MATTFIPGQDDSIDPAVLSEWVEANKKRELFDLPPLPHPSSGEGAPSVPGLRPIERPMEPQVLGSNAPVRSEGDLFRSQMMDAIRGFIDGGEVDARQRMLESQIAEQSGQLLGKASGVAAARGVAGTGAEGVARERVLRRASQALGAGQAQLEGQRQQERLQAVQIGQSLMAQELAGRQLDIAEQELALSTFQNVWTMLINDNELNSDNEQRAFFDEWMGTLDQMEAARTPEERRSILRIGQARAIAQAADSRAPKRRG